jgi:hypothetical protein
MVIKVEEKTAQTPPKEVEREEDGALVVVDAAGSDEEVSVEELAVGWLVVDGEIFTVKA